MGNANPTTPACAYLVTPELQNIGNKTDLASLVPPGQPVSGQVTAPGTFPEVRNYTALWEYDTLGNRMSEIEEFSLGGSSYSSETTYTYSGNTSLRLESEVRSRFDEFGNLIDTTNLAYTYTRNGSLSKRITNGTEEEQWFYNYREVAGAYIKGGGSQEAWVYNFDPMGNRIAKRNLLSQQEDWFLVEGGDVQAEYQRDSGATVETLKHTYFSGLTTDSKIARVDANGSAETAYFFTDDKMGTVHQLLTESGAEYQRQLSNAWGEDLPDFESLMPAVPDPHGLHQRRKDKESGLMYFRNRLYDPTSGRFTQNDPIRGIRPTEHYIYAFNNPLSFTDVLGLQGAQKDYPTNSGPGVYRLARQEEINTPAKIDALFARHVMMYARGAISGKMHYWIEVRQASLEDLDKVAIRSRKNDDGYRKNVKASQDEAKAQLAERKEKMWGSLTDGQKANSWVFGQKDPLKAEFWKDDPAAQEHWRSTVDDGASYLAGYMYLQLSFLPGSSFATGGTATGARTLTFTQARAALNAAARKASANRLVRVSQHRVFYKGFEVRGVRGLDHVPEGQLRAMAKKGFAPKDKRGNSLILHHHRQNPSGPLVEMPGKNHSIGNPRQHPFGNTPGAGLSSMERETYNLWRVEYWQRRATEELLRRGLK